MQFVILSTDTLYEVGSLSAMWIVMMAIMMFPTTAPWLIAVRNISTSSPMRTVPMFLGGYLFIWMLFSFGAAIMQHLLHKAALASHMGHPVTPYVGAALLALAGLFQLTALKRRCLAHCQSPVSFFLSRWRDGRLGALQMGVHHGVYCLGCCWALMLLAFVSGVMNLVWMVGITVYVFVDQAILKSPTLTTASGFLLLGCSAWILVAMQH